MRKREKNYMTAIKGWMSSKMTDSMYIYSILNMEKYGDFEMGEK